MTKTKSNLSTKPLKKEVEPTPETPLVSIFPDDAALLKVFKKSNITSVEQLRALTDEEILHINGIRATRLGNIRVALGKSRYPKKEAN